MSEVPLYLTNLVRACYNGKRPTHEIVAFAASSDVCTGVPRPPTMPHHCRVSMAHIRQARPDFGLVFQVKILILSYVISYSL